MEKILLVGDDFTLLATRVAILAKMGASVVGCDPLELSIHLGNERFDLVILCHTLKLDARRSVIKNARRRWPQVRILQLFSRLDPTAADAFPVDAVASTDPDDLIEQTAKLLGRPPRKPPVRARQPRTQWSNVA
jgi:hypothetical protein